MVTLTADVMHVCKLQGIDINWLIEQSRAKFEQEEKSLARSDTTGQAAA